MLFLLLTKEDNVKDIITLAERTINTPIQDCSAKMMTNEDHSVDLPAVASTSPSIDYVNACPVLYGNRDINTVAAKTSKSTSIFMQRALWWSYTAIVAEPVAPTSSSTLLHQCLNQTNITNLRQQQAQCK